MTTHEALPHSGDLNEQARILGVHIFEAESQGVEYARQKEIVQRAVREVLSVYPNPRQRRTLQIAAGIVDWFYFGEPNEELPFGLIKLVDGRTKSIHVDVDETVISGDDAACAWDLFHLHIDGEEDFDRPVIREPNQVMTDMTALIQATEGYKLVQSFLIDPPVAPQAGLLEGPMKLIRQRQVQDIVRRRFGLRPDAPIDRHSVADNMLRAELNRLETEVSLMQESQRGHKKDTLIIENIRHYFEPYIIAQLQDVAGATIRVRSFKFDEDNDIYSAYPLSSDGTQAPVVQIGPYDYLADMYAILRQAGGYVLNGTIEAGYLEALCNQIFDEVNGASLAERLQRALDQASRFAVHEFLTASPGWAVPEWQNEVLSFRAFVRQAGGRMLYTSTYNTFKHAPSTLAKNSAHPYRTETNEHTIGDIIQPAFFRSSPRLIQQTTAPSTPLPTYSNRAELLFTFSGSLPTGTILFVPGFQAISYDPATRRWGFASDPSGDPYSEARVTVPMQRVNALADLYYKIGLQSLAQHLRSATTLTINELVDSIESYTHYINSKQQASFDATKLEDCVKYVENDTLKVQCLGSGWFLKWSLDTLFGKGHATVQEGLLLRTYGRAILSTRHAQVSFGYNGQTYILDATGAEKKLFAAFAGVIGRFLLRNNVQQAPYIGPSTTMQEQKGPTETLLLTSEEQLASNKALFERRLMNVFNLHNEQQFYRYLAGLSKDDPLRRTVSTLLENPPSSETLRDTVTYIVAVMEATKQKLRETNLQAYADNETLYLARTALERALTIIRDTE